MALRRLSIRGVRLAAPGFAWLPRADPEVALPPGDRVDLPVGYGGLACTPASGPDRAEPRAAASG